MSETKSNKKRYSTDNDFGIFSMEESQTQADKSSNKHRKDQTTRIIICGDSGMFSPKFHLQPTKYDTIKRNRKIRTGECIDIKEHCTEETRYSSTP